ncbi:MAG: hypothetical protein K0S65_1774 [Labilithrix sp.]|nr:hypothetical protein [Labilithrix sp.]
MRELRDYAAIAIRPFGVATTIESLTLALATVAHLANFDRDATIGGNALPNTRAPT